MRTVRPLAVAFGFLSRLPVGNDPVAAADLARSLTWFPVVGLAFGGVLAGTAHLLRDHLPAPLLAVGLVALLAALSGGLHLDGLADVFDGLGGGRGDREKTLAIMRDSRIGAHGAMALVLALAAKVAAVHEVLRSGATWPLLCCPVLGRWSSVPLVIFFPYARQEGLGRAMTDHGRPLHFAQATLLAGACVVWSGDRVLGPSAAALAAALGIALFVRRRLGGLTGDVYGAAIELAEIAFLAAACGLVHPAGV
jgi:adenosylcobinamide-GDP ribazoletransferase